MQNTDNFRHSLSHLLAAAVLKKFPKAKFGIGPVIENGFYYDFELPRPLTQEDLNELEKAVRELIKLNLLFSREEISIAEAKKLFKDQPFKLELIEELSKTEKTVSIYKTADVFTDLCKGGHVENTSEINPDGFKLDKTAGAYWRGDEKNPMLTRIYGLAFATKKELDEYVAREEEAKKRDHKKLGPELDLFTFSELVGSGLPLWTPKGTVLRNILDNFVWELRKKAGYVQVDIPHLTKKDLYEKSGHWEKFKDELFKITTREGHIFALKPMNCPHHTQIYARKPHSYRELPQRYATTTKVYRDEQTGELSGLSRVRAITQDDAHVFCRKSQIREEMEKIWDIIEIFYKAVGFTLSIRLSLRDPKQPKKYLGSAKTWDESENELRALVAKRKVKAEEAIGEAAFYGPKIDFIGKDSLGREWQVATIQLDMNMPENFDLTCTNEEGKPERVVMIHAAIMGSIERYLAIIIEHFAGAFPLWLAPVQVAVLPVSDKHVPYAKTVMKTLEEHGIRTELPEANETLGKRIRAAELMKVPLIVVVGDKEAGDKSVNVRERGIKETQTIPLTKFVEETAKRAAERK
ncbi:MAG: threonine--tRNA ligase [Candidatus Jorgensenbacteria bacterium]|nr:threonine--tRNA ligase [Candidatus Jorgensenbacteria bacterium]